MILKVGEPTGSEWRDEEICQACGSPNVLVNWAEGILACVDCREVFMPDSSIIAKAEVAGYSSQTTKKESS